MQMDDDAIEVTTPMNKSLTHGVDHPNLVGVLSVLIYRSTLPEYRDESIWRPLGILWEEVEERHGPR